MTKKKEIVLAEVEGSVAIYVNGKLIVENDNFSPSEILDAIEVKYRHFQPTDEQFEEAGNSFPENLNEIEK